MMYPHVFVARYRLGATQFILSNALYDTSGFPVAFLEVNWCTWYLAVLFSVSACSTGRKG